VLFDDGDEVVVVIADPAVVGRLCGVVGVAFAKYSFLARQNRFNSRGLSASPWSSSSSRSCRSSGLQHNTEGHCVLYAHTRARGDGGSKGPVRSELRKYGRHV
jgi:hypothetical protein